MDNATTNAGHIKAENLTVAFLRERSAIAAIEDLTFEIQSREFVCFLGTSGCGKSTILNLIAGFISPSSGSVWIDGNAVSQPDPDRGVVFQQFALFPWLTVTQNIEFGLRMKSLESKRRREIVQSYVEMVGLQGFEKNYPDTLSGGMQQRVAIARALVNDPSVILMDEPFGSLDAQTRLMMQEMLLDIWQKAHKTVVFVTHDVDEAIFLADRILILTARPGRVKKEIVVGLPRPRTYKVTTSPDYAKLKGDVVELIREETLKAITTTGLSK
jgi:NitT/TauT family transport system ATP-binding protein